MNQEMMRWLSRVLNGVVVGLGKIFAQNFLAQKNTFFDESQPKIQPSMTHMTPIILSKPLLIIVWVYQEMMRWLRRLLNVVMVSLGRIFGSSAIFWGKRIHFLMKPSCKFNPA
jgi:hypothetical protein